MRKIDLHRPAGLKDEQRFALINHQILMLIPLLRATAMLFLFYLWIANALDLLKYSSTENQHVFYPVLVPKIVPVGVICNYTRENSLTGNVIRCNVEWLRGVAYCVSGGLNVQKSNIVYCFCCMSFLFWHSLIYWLYPYQKCHWNKLKHNMSAFLVIPVRCCYVLLKPH